MSDVVILGVAAYHHGRGAVVLRGGKMIAAATQPAEDREIFPSVAIRECFRQASLSPADLDLVALVGKPHDEFAQALRRAFGSPTSLATALRPWLTRLDIRDALEQVLGRSCRGRCVFFQEASNELEAAQWAWHKVLSHPSDERTPAALVAHVSNRPMPGSYFSPGTPGLPLNRVARTFAGLTRPRRDRRDTARLRRGQDESVPDEIYTLW